MKFIKNIIREVNKMKLIVGLGNPGIEYEKTRHNVGYMFLDYITKNSNFELNKKFKAFQYENNFNGEKLLFIKPITFMNNSGESVVKYVNYYKIQPEDILIIQDDLDMPIGKYKLMYNHGDGGHNGIKNIILNLNSREFLRLKIGISKATIDTKDYVLGKFSKKEFTELNNTFDKLNNFIQDYVSLNRDLLMGKYNAKEKEVNK